MVIENDPWCSTPGSRPATQHLLARHDDVAELRRSIFVWIPWFVTATHSRQAYALVRFLAHKNQPATCMWFKSVPGMGLRQIRMCGCVKGVEESFV